MTIQLTSVREAGIAIRTLRKRAGIRIDDFALLAGVSKQFVSDVENGKPTAQMGKVLELLQRLGIKVVMQLSTTDVEAFQRELHKAQSEPSARPRGKST